MGESVDGGTRRVSWTRVAVGAGLALHGLAHLPGAVAAWGWGDAAEDETWLQVSGAAAVLVGVLWCLGAAGYLWGGVLVARSRPATRVLTAVTVFSLALCAVSVPAAVVGLVIDVVVLGVLAVLVVRERSHLRVAG